MKSRYDGAPGKDASMSNKRQSRFEAEHSAKNAFVKKVQAEQSRHGGRPPKMSAELMDFCSYMSNDGVHAQELAVGLTAGLDKVAYPVKSPSGGKMDAQ
jgi:hypothetical protein